MRPLGLNENEQLRYAREHASELRHDWRMANGKATDGTEAGGARMAPKGIVASARLGAGRTLIGLGTMLLPRREPCA